MERAKSLLVVAAGLGLLSPPLGAGGPTAQMSQDTPAAFAAVFLHGPLVGPLDAHIDVFGGANWSNDVAFAGDPFAPPPGLGIPDTVSLNLQRFVHSFAPHGEAPGPDFGPQLASISAAPAPVNLPAFWLTVQQLDHQNHKDDLGYGLLGVGNNSRLGWFLGIVSARHIAPGQWFVCHDLDRLEPASGSRTTGDAAGLAALQIDGEHGTAVLALGVAGTDIEASGVTVHAGRSGVVLEAGGEELESVAGLGASGVLRRKLTAEAIAQIQKGGAVVTVATSAGKLSAELCARAPLAPPEQSEKVPNPCRATVPVRVAHGSQGPAADRCDQTEAQAAAFDAASDSLCAAAQCQGDCRTADASCKPQIPLLPDPADLTCWRTPMADCEQGQGWRCKWASPQWFNCECACRG